MEDFKSYIRSMGLDPPEHIPTEKWVRFPGAGKGPKNTAGFAYFFENGLAGICGDHSSGIQETWKSKETSNYTGAEKANFEKIIKASKKRAEERAAKEYTKSSKIAQELCKGLSSASGSHPYLKAKQVQSYGLLEHEDKLVMPLYNAKGKITTYQTIAPDGQKRFLSGGKVKGSAFFIKGDRDRLFVVEGYSTGATVHEATGCSVLVAINAGNLLPVVEDALKKDFGQIIIAGDNDYSLKTNVGVEKAEAVQVKFPQVKIQIPPKLKGHKGTDWNDIAVEKGLSYVSEVFERKIIKSTSVAKIMSTEYPVLKWAAKGIIPEGMTILAGPPKFGKSWMMMGLSYAISTGTPAWHFAETVKSSVYYLALEDSERRIKDRIHMMEGYFNEYPKNLHIYTEFPRIGEGFLEELTAIRERDDNVGLIIVDTLQKIRPRSTGKRGIYQAEYEDYEKLQSWAIKNGIPVVCVHHTRKGTGGKENSQVDRISGSTGIQGVADTLIVCGREEKSSKGLMHVTGRDVNEEDYQLEFDRQTMTWEVIPPEATVDIGPVALSTWFSKHGKITVKEAAKLWDMTQRPARLKLEKLFEEGGLTRETEKGSKAFVYKLANQFMPKHKEEEPEKKGSGWGG